MENRIAGEGGASFPAGSRGERGIALVLSLVLLMLLGLLGAMVLNTSTTDLRITGNYRNAQEAYYIAEAAVAYASTDNSLTNARLNDPFGLGIVWSTPDFAVGAGNATATVTFLQQDDIPTGLKTDSDACAAYFVINATGRGAGNTEATIHTSMFQVIPQAKINGKCK